MQTHVVNKGNTLAEFFITVNTWKPEQVSYLFVLISQRVCAKFFGAKVTAKMFLALEGMAFHVVLPETVFPLERQALLPAVVVGAKEPPTFLSHWVVGLGYVIHRLGFKSACIS